MKGWGTDVLAMAAQVGLFLAGLAVSIVIGIALAAVLDGPGGLLIATGIAGTGLLVVAGLSQTLHDYIVQRDLDRDRA